MFALNSNIVLGQIYMQTLNVQVPITLKFINIDNKPTAYYELFLTNFSTDTLKFKSLSISNVIDSSIQFSSQNQDLQNRWSRIGFAKKDTTMWLTPGIRQLFI